MGYSMRVAVPPSLPQVASYGETSDYTISRRDQAYNFDLG